MFRVTQGDFGQARGQCVEEWVKQDGLGHWLQFRGTEESKATEEGLSSWDQVLAGRRGDL